MNLKIFNDGTFLFPIDGQYYPQSDYLRTAIEDEKVRWIANCVTTYRHTQISSWDKMWQRGRRGKAYQKAAKFGDYDEEKAKVNERAKRQLIRKCYPVFKQMGIEAKHFMELQNTDWETIALANKHLSGPVKIPADALSKKEPKKKKYMAEVLTDNSKMPYGIHKDKAMIEVPADYLIWIYENDKCSASVKAYIVANMDVLKSQVKK